NPAPSGDFKTSYRTHHCAELRPEHVGKEATLCGAVDRRIDARTFELRDGHGKTLVKLGDQAAQFLGMQLVDAPEVPLESIVMPGGVVRAREPADPAQPSGGVYLDAIGCKLLAQANANIVFDHHAADIDPRE